MLFHTFLTFSDYISRRKLRRKTAPVPKTVSPSSIIYLFLPIAAASPPVSLICIPLDLNGSLLINDLLSLSPLV